VTTLNSERSTPNFIWPVRVYYDDTDAGGVVYYANYLKFMERARTEWLRALGFEQTSLLRDHNRVFVVRALTIEFLRPALFNDWLEAEVELSDARGSWIEVVQTIRRGTLTLVTAKVKVACVNTQTFKPVRIPELLLEKIAMRQV
jgi:acyl-CoA thioester hydrolase